mmetsp:Transcript_20334/g.51199  ORF Transcript_20334/g.51199 Transcript_20334/m.51199 type:complete len:313 (-) Transcript_20334:233-1171(-)
MAVYMLTGGCAPSLPLPCLPKKPALAAAWCHVSSGFIDAGERVQLRRRQHGEAPSLGAKAVVFATAVEVPVGAVHLGVSLGAHARVAGGVERDAQEGPHHLARRRLLLRPVPQAQALRDAALQPLLDLLEAPQLPHPLGAVDVCGAEKLVQPEQHELRQRGQQLPRGHQQHPRLDALLLQKLRRQARQLRQRVPRVGQPAVGQLVRVVVQLRDVSGRLAAQWHVLQPLLVQLHGDPHALRHLRAHLLERTGGCGGVQLVCGAAAPALIVWVEAGHVRDVDLLDLTIEKVVVYEVQDGVLPPFAQREGLRLWA